MLDKLRNFINRGSSRSAMAKKNIMAMFMLRGVSVLCSLLVVSLSINYVSDYEYGLWIAISSIVTWISYFDLGLGNGMRNKFIEATEKGKHRLARIYVSTAYVLITAVVACVWIAAVTASFFIDWCSVLNADRSFASELKWTMVIAVTVFSLIFVLGQNRTLIYAVQRPAISSSFDTATQVMFCIVLALMIKFTTGSLIYLALAMGVSYLSVLIFANIWTFGKFLPRYAPSLRYFRLSMSRYIMSLGVSFFILQIISLVLYQTNNLVISHFAGPSEVTVYNVAFKYTNLINMLFTIIVTPFWSAYAEAYVNGDFAWLKSATRKLVRISALMCGLGVVMTIISPIFYHLWLHDMVAVPMSVTAMVCIFNLLSMWLMLWTYLLSGLSKVRMLIICSALCCIFYLPATILACKYYGLTGMLIASSATFALFTSWPGIIQVNKIINRRATGIWNK